MEVRMKLSDKNRAELGVEQEWLSVDPYAVSLDEVIVLQKGVEIEGVVCSFDSANDWRAGIDKGDAFAVKVLVWLGLRRAGIKADLATMQVDANFEWDIVPDATDPGEPGKEQSDPETTS